MQKDELGKGSSAISSRAACCTRICDFDEKCFEKWPQSALTFSCARWLQKKMLLPRRLLTEFCKKSRWVGVQLPVENHYAVSRIQNFRKMPKINGWISDEGRISCTFALIVFKQRHYQDRTFSILNIRFCRELIDGVEIKFVRSRVVTVDFITSVVSGYIWYWNIFWGYS